MRVLVADDAPGLRLLVRRVLDGHQVFEADNGHEALRLLRSARPEVAVLDVNMPGLSGLEVCREIRNDPLLATTFVVVITANGTAYDRRRAFEAGADRFIAKPFSPRHLSSLVEEGDPSRQERSAG